MALMMTINAQNFLPEVDEEVEFLTGQDVTLECNIRNSILSMTPVRYEKTSFKPTCRY